MIELITDNLTEIQSACREFDVDALWVFGSALGNDWIEGESDVDFLASFGRSKRSLFRQHMGLIGRLQDILGVRVDVVDVRSISKPTLREQVEHTRELLFERSRQAVSV